ncbi:hypothetical protein ACEWPM_009130 [Roseovarius sp. S4756]
MFSFDGEAATNGFHPLWQVMVWVLAQITGDPVLLMNLTAWLAVALTLAGVLMIGTAIGRATGSWLLAGLVTPGVYFLVVGQGLGNLAVWDFFSGMEAGLSLAITGILSLQIVSARHERATARHWLSMGVVLGLLVLARLDEVFVVLAIALTWTLWHPRRFFSRVPSAILLVLPSVAFLCLYWAYNWATIGLLMPISGAAKGEGALIGNGWITLATFFGPLLDLRAGLTDYTAAHDVVRGAGFRVAELIFPALFAATFILLIHGRFRDENWAPLVAGMSGAILLKAAYGFIAVNYWDQAPWYYAFAIGTLSLTAALLLSPVLTNLRRVAPSAVPWLALIIGLVGCLQASQAYLANASGRYSAPRAMFWEDRGKVDAALAEARPEAKLVEFGDGMLNFALDLPVRHGFVFAGDIGSLEALRRRSLLRASHEDGYTMLSSYEYLNWPGASLDKSSDDIRAFLLGSTLDDRVKAELNEFEFEMVYIYEPLSIPFIAFHPLPAT